MQHKNYEIYITSSFPFVLSTASLPAGVPDTLAFISESFPFNEVRSAGRSASFLSGSASCVSSSMPIASFPFSPMFRRAFSTVRRSSFSLSSASSSYSVRLSSEILSVSTIMIFLSAFTTTPPTAIAINNFFPFFYSFLFSLLGIVTRKCCNKKGRYKIFR